MRRWAAAVIACAWAQCVVAVSPTKTGVTVIEVSVEARCPPTATGVQYRSGAVKCLTGAAVESVPLGNDVEGTMYKAVVVAPSDALAYGAQQTSVGGVTAWYIQTGSAKVATTGYVRTERADGRDMAEISLYCAMVGLIILGWSKGLDMGDDTKGGIGES